MNGQYYKNPKFPTIEQEEENSLNKENDNRIIDYSFTDFLNWNKSKYVNIYCINGTYNGYIEQVGNEFLVLVNNDKKRVVIFLSNIEHIEFDESINYKNVLENI